MGLSRRITTILCFAAVLLGTAALLLWRLDAAPLADWDEGIYAIVAHEQLVHPSIIPTLFGESWLEKPPLGFWIHAAVMGLTGEGTWGLRLGPALAMIAGAGFLFALTRRRWGNGFALLVTLLCVTSPALFAPHMVRTGDLEGYFFLAVVAAMWAYDRARERPWMLAVAAGALGLGFMARGFIAILPLAALVAHLVWTGEWRKYSWRMLAGAAGVFLVLVLPWHVVAWLTVPDAFTSVYVQDQFWNRLTTPLQGHGGSWDVYTWYLVDRLGKAPLILAAYAIILAGVRTLRRRDRDDALWFFWIAAFAAALVFMPTRLYWYLFAAIPALYLLGAQFVRRIWDVPDVHLRALVAFAMVLGIGFSLHADIVYLQESTSATDVRMMLVETLRARGIAERSIAVYGVDQWVNGQLYPAAYVRWRLEAGLDIQRIRDPRLDELVGDDPFAQVVITDPEIAHLVKNVLGERWEELDARVMQDKKEVYAIFARVR